MWVLRRSNSVDIGLVRVSEKVSMELDVVKRN